jgi:hypothetical protein
MPAINASVESYCRWSEKTNPYQQELQFLHIKRTVCLAKRCRRRYGTTAEAIITGVVAIRVATLAKLFGVSSCVCVRPRPRASTRLHLAHRVIDHLKRACCGWDNNGFARDVARKMQLPTRHGHNTGRRKKVTPVNNRPAAVRTAGNKLLDIFSPKSGCYRARAGASASLACTNGRKHTTGDA